VAAWFPAVGLGLGLVAWLPVHLATRAGWDGSAALVVAALVVTMWAMLTRLLHWDGLADVADGLWGGDTPARRLEIMSDSAIGAFGAAALVMIGAILVASVGALLMTGALLPVLVTPALARLSATCAAWLGQPARDDGLGRSIMGRPQWSDVGIALLTVLAASVPVIVSFGIAGAGFVVAGVMLGLAVPHLLSGPVRGVTGDIMGASVMLCEAGLFALAAILWGA